MIGGEPIIYIVDLHNPGDQPVVLSPCGGYLQTLDGARTTLFTFELYCAEARVIPARGDEPFVIEMPYYTAAPGEHMLCWGLAPGISSKPPACAKLTVLR